MKIAQIKGTICIREQYFICRKYQTTIKRYLGNTIQYCCLLYIYYVVLGENSIKIVYLRHLCPVLLNYISVGCHCIVLVPPFRGGEIHLELLLIVCLLYLLQKTKKNMILFNSIQCHDLSIKHLSIKQSKDNQLLVLLSIKV